MGGPGAGRVAACPAPRRPAPRTAESGWNRHHGHDQPAPRAASQHREPPASTGSARGHADAVRQSRQPHAGHP